MYCIAYGRQGLSFELPEGVRVRLAVPDPHPAVPDIAQVLEESLRRPLASPPLRDLARPGDRVCIAITDASRPCPHKLLLPPILAGLRHAGVSDKDVYIIIATGLHRPSTEKEKEALLGDEIPRRYRLIDHLAAEPGQLEHLGRTEDGIPITVNRLAYEADLLLATGVVELHQYAGYSGGGKTVGIGLAGEPTIRRVHSLAMLERTGIGVGNVCGNPFRQAVEEIARAAGLRFVVNVVLNQRQQVAHLAAGEPRAVLAALADSVRRMSSVGIDRPCRLVIAGVGYPKDANLYQLSRAASYLAYGPNPAVAEGGVIILAAEDEEGIGGGLAEQGFYELMSRAADPNQVIARLKRDEGQPGGQRAYVMAQVLKICRVMIVGSRYPELARRIGFIPAEDMPQALGLARRMLGVLDEALIVPRGMQTLVDVSAGGKS
jgi:nickel-dependent lactate racemase